MIHPKNLRRFYPFNQVKEMAESIRAAGGVIQAMIVTPSGKEGIYYVIDGNVRLHGARVLGKDCPQLKCEVVSTSMAEQMLAMVITAKFRYEPDPISEALHYKRLQDDEKYSIKQIAHGTGVHTVTIMSRLKLLELEPEIQELIGLGKLPVDRRAVEALMSVPSKARVKLADRLAKDNVSVKAIEGACQRLVEKIAEAEKNKDVKSTGSALKLGMQRAFRKKIAPAAKVTWKNVRKAAQIMCETCDVKVITLKKVGEPAWSLVADAADGMCSECTVKEIRGVCGNALALT